MRTLIVLYAAAVVFGGAANLFRPYMKFAGVFYAVFAVGYFAFTGMWKFISRIRQNTKNLPEVTLYTSLGVKKVIGLIDTGNELRVLASDDPVNIIDPPIGRVYYDSIRNGKRLSYDSVQQHRGRWSDEGVSD